MVCLKIVTVIKKTCSDTTVNTLSHLQPFTKVLLISQGAHHVTFVNDQIFAITLVVKYDFKYKRGTLVIYSSHGVRERMEGWNSRVPETLEN